MEDRSADIWMAHALKECNAVLLEVKKLIASQRDPEMSSAIERRIESALRHSAEALSAYRDEGGVG